MQHVVIAIEVIESVVCDGTFGEADCSASRDLAGTWRAKFRAGPVLNRDCSAETNLSTAARDDGDAGGEAVKLLHARAVHK